MDPNIILTLKVGNISKVVRQKCRLNQSNAKLPRQNTSRYLIPFISRRYNCMGNYRIIDMVYRN